jgi:hypothetical protein
MTEKEEHFESLCEFFDFDEFERIALWELLRQIDEITFPPKPEDEEALMEIGRLCSAKMMDAFS